MVWVFGWVVGLWCGGLVVLVFVAGFWFAVVVWCFSGCLCVFACDGRFASCRLYGTCLACWFS